MYRKTAPNDLKSSEIVKIGGVFPKQPMTEYQPGTGMGLDLFDRRSCKVFINGKPCRKRMCDTNIDRPIYLPTYLAS